MSDQPLWSPSPERVRATQVMAFLGEANRRHQLNLASYHDLHAWSLSSDVIALSAHLVMAGHPTLEEAQEVADRVKRAVAGPFGIAHATLELECETCVPDGADPCAMETLGTTAGSAE